MSNASKERTPCSSCKNMVCRTRFKDCYDVHDSSLSIYQNQKGVKDLAHAASALIDNGRAGTMSRVEEIVEFCQIRQYQRVGLAYCYGIKSLADDFSSQLQRVGVTVLPVACTSGAVKESEIDNNKNNDVVSCNPAGQAEVLNNLSLDFVIEMGLCLGHDVIFHRQLEVPFSVFVVKDRVHTHNPAAALDSYMDSATKFITTLDDSFRMVSPQWLQERLDTEVPTVVLDLRGAKAFEQSRIAQSVNCCLQELPTYIPNLHRFDSIVCICNGSVQSAYAIMFLYSRGFTNVYNLSGGFSRWTKEYRPVVC